MTKILMCTRQQVSKALKISMASTNVLFGLAHDGSFGPKRQKRDGVIRTVYPLEPVLAWLERTCLKFGYDAEQVLRAGAFELDMR